MFFNGFGREVFQYVKNHFIDFLFYPCLSRTYKDLLPVEPVEGAGDATTEDTQEPEGRVSFIYAQDDMGGGGPDTSSSWTIMFCFSCFLMRFPL